MKIFVIKKTSQKSGKQYTALVLNKDGKEIVLTFDRMTILRASNMTLNDLDNLKENEPYYI